MLAACGGDQEAPAVADDHADEATAGGGLPSGFMGHTDAAGGDISGANYSRSGNDWEVSTGPAHIAYQPSDTASGTFTATAELEQLAAPAHPESFGIFVGGSNLDDPATRRYSYFMVRGTGEYLLRRRQGEDVPVVSAWAEHPSIPRQDAEGRATYRLEIRSAPDSVRFAVNGTVVKAVAASEFPTAGIAGIRVSHNTRLRVQPVAITR
jgi:hypothetical protein